MAATDRSNIEKIARTPEEKMLLAKVWDRIQAGIRRQIPTATCFLTPGEQEQCRFLFGNAPGLFAFGGYPEAERKLLCYLPEYLEEDYLLSDDSPVVCLRAVFREQDVLTHRDFLGALMGAGIARDTLGDICVCPGSCDFFVTQQIAPYILQNLTEAGRVGLQVTQIPLLQAQIPEPEVRQIKDTLASLRLDSAVSSGFRIGRSLAAQMIAAGKASIDGIPCQKPDKPIVQGMKISVRGLGKIKINSVNGQTKKGRIAVVIDRYI